MSTEEDGECVAFPLGDRCEELRVGQRILHVEKPKSV